MGYANSADFETGGTTNHYPTSISNAYVILAVDMDYGCDSLGVKDKTNGTFSAWAQKADYNTSTYFHYLVIAK